MNGESDIHVIGFSRQGFGGSFECGIGKSAIEVEIQERVAILRDVEIRERLALCRSDICTKLVLGKIAVPDDLQFSHQGLGTFIHLDVDGKLVLMAKIVIFDFACNLDLLKTIVQIEIFQTTDIVVE